MEYNYNMKRTRLHIRIAELHDGESSRLGATADLSELANVSNAPEKMTRLETDYKAMLEKIRILRKKSKTDVLSKWRLADVIFSFLERVRRSDLMIESHLKVVCRDTSISRTEMKYLLRFRRTYALVELDKNVSWSTYRSMLYKKIPYGKDTSRGNRRKS